MTAPDGFDQIDLVAQVLNLADGEVLDHAVVLGEGIDADGDRALWVVRVEAGSLDSSLRLLAAAQLAWLDPDSDEVTP